MKKEALTFKNVKRDLDRMAYSRMSSAEDHRLGYIIPAVLLAVILAVVFKSVVVTLLLVIFAAYHTVYFVIAEESRTHIGFKRYFCPSLRCPSSEYDSTPSLDAP